MSGYFKLTLYGSGPEPRINEALRPALRLTLKKRRPQRGHHWVRQMGDLFGHRSLALEIIKRSDQVKSLQLLPRRWVVERTFGCLMKSRSPVRDHERKSSHHEAFVDLAMTGFATRRPTK